MHWTSLSFSVRRPMLAPKNGSWSHLSSPLSPSFLPCTFPLFTGKLGRLAPAVLGSHRAYLAPHIVDLPPPLRARHDEATLVLPRLQELLKVLAKVQISFRLGQRRQISFLKASSLKNHSLPPPLLSRSLQFPSA